MKFFIAFALIAVASATYLKPTGLTGDLAEIQQVIDAINHPSTDPATAVLLEQMLLETLGVSLAPQPIAVGPAIVDTLEPISVGPAIVDFPLPDGGAVSAPVAVAPVAVAPAAVAPVTAADSSAASPLVQIILNINSAAGAAGVTPVAVVDQPEPINVVDSAVNPMPNPIPSPVVLPPAPEPVTVVETAPEAVVVVESAPEPVLVAQPVLPVAPVVVLPDVLN